MVMCVRSNDPPDWFMSCKTACVLMAALAVVLVLVDSVCASSWDLVVLIAQCRLVVCARRIATEMAFVSGDSASALEAGEGNCVTLNLPNPARMNAACEENALVDSVFASLASLVTTVLM